MKIITKLTNEKRENLLKDLETLMNKYGIDTICNVPDFILADTLLDTIYSIEKLQGRTNKWFRRGCEIGRNMSTDIKFLQRAVAKLWDILDNIDNYAELNINDTDENNPFRNICHKTSERFKYVRSDGYNLFIDDECIDDKGMVKVFCTPKGDTDKLATEVSIRGTKIYPPKGMLIGKVTPKDNSFFVEFVDNDEKPTDTDKKAIGFRFEVKQVYADRPPEYTMVEVPMDEALYRNIPKVSDFPYDNRVKFLDYAETYLKAKGLIPIDNVSLTRYEIIYDGCNLTSTASIEDENIDTFIEYLTTQHKYMHSEKCKRRCEKLIKQMKMAKIISEIMELKGDEEITDTDKKDENAIKDSSIKPSGTVEIGYAGDWDFDDFTRELTRIETNYLGKTGEMDYCIFLAVLSHIRKVYEKLHKGEGM